MKDLARFNNNFRYLLVCVDIATKYAFVKLLKNKTSENVKNKFEDLLKENNVLPDKIQCDEGTEFQKIRGELKNKYGFTVFHTFNREIKASHAERFIQTLKLMIRRALTVLKTNRYVGYLKAIVERYNESPHRGLFGLTPVDVYYGRKKISENKKLKNVLNFSPYVKKIFKKGERVRISRIKNNIFEKSSLRRWRNEIFTIDKVYITNPVTYKIKDVDGDIVKGIFYREELKKVS